MIFSMALYVLFLIYCLKLYFKKLPMMGVLNFYFVTTVVWQSISSIYLDISGNTFSGELGKFIDVNFSGLFLVLALWVITLGIDLGLNRKRLAQLQFNVNNLVPNNWRITGIDYQSLGIFIVISFLALAYVEMIYIGNIPIFSEIDKKDYFQFYMGPIGKEFFRYSMLICFFLGFGVYSEVIRTSGKYKLPIAIFIAFLFYLFMQGNRFSAIFLHLSYFLFPVFILFFRNNNFVASISVIHRLKRLTVLWGVVGAIVFGAVLVNYFGTLDALNVSSTQQSEIFFERILVQQGQMWSATFSLLAENISILPNFEAINRILFSEELGDGNKAIFYLMRLHGGINYFHMLLSGHRYTGASPIIFVVMFNLLLCWPIMFAFGYCVGWVIALIARWTTEGRIFLALALVWVFMPINMLLIDGDTKFLINPIYYLKISMVFFILLVGDSVGISSAYARWPGKVGQNANTSLRW